MDRFEIFRFENVLAYTFVLVELDRNIPHHILDKFGIIVGAFGHIFLIGALE